ncbi:MAG: thioredoxin family protein [Sulfurimonas sp.]|nr:thioredoxin family protein [Sulfurimonas sp.]
MKYKIKRENMAIIDVDEENFQQTIYTQFKKKNIVILKFGSEFCDACMALEGELEDLEEENKNICIINIECSESPDLAERYHVQKVPTMVIYKDGENVIYRAEGVVLSQDIEEIIS